MQHLNRAILIQAHSQLRGLFVGIARLAGQRENVPIHLYVSTQQERDYYLKSAPATFASITVTPSLYHKVGTPVEDVATLLTRAEQWEQALECSLNQIALTDRHFGRGFALGGYRHPRSKYSELSDRFQVVRGIVDQIEFWASEIDRHDPCLLINCGKIGAVVAQRRRIPHRQVVGSRFRSLHYWASDEYGAHPGLAAAYAAAEPDGAPSLDRPYTSHLEVRTQLARQYRLLSTIRSSARMIAQQLYWTARRYDKAKGYYLNENISYIWRRSSSSREIQRTFKTSLSDIRGKKFVYFPLHMEPEIALQGFSPECFSQLSCIASLARDMPSDTLLAVKETMAAVGRRPRDFYGQIREFKNVVLLRPEEFGLEAAKEATATATITGTGGFEAAISGRPVLTFGRHNLYNILPHVFRVECEDAIRPALLKALDPGFDRTTAAIAGARFLNAVIATSFDMKDFRIFASDAISETALEDAYRSLVQSLDGAATAALDNTAAQISDTDRAAAG